MQSKTILAGRPAHPMLVVLPIALYVGSFAAFVIYATTHVFVWWEMALWANVLGVATAVIAAVPGAIDLFTVAWKHETARPVGVVHMALSLGALLLFAVNLLVQQGSWAQMPSELRALFHLVHVVKPDVTLALLLSGSGVAVTGVAGLFGWTLVRKYRIGVDDDGLRAARASLAPSLPQPGARS